MRVHFVIAALLSAILIYLLVSATDNPVDIASRTAELRQAEYDYYMNSIDNTVFAADGRSEYRIRADRLTHYPVGDIAVLDAPVFHFYEEGSGQPWRITAATALIDTDAGRNEQRVQLDTDVVIHRVDESGRTLDIHTEFLTVYPDSKTLDTNRAVRITSPGSLVTAIGMTGDLNTRLIHLLSDVQGNHE